MTADKIYSMLRAFLLVLLLAGQGIALAHGIDEASHPSQDVCDLCVASHGMGSPAVESHSGWPHQAPLKYLKQIPATPISAASAFTPSQRAPPISR